MVKVFTLNEKGKIELSKQELESLLNESYWDGYYASKWTYASPDTNPIKITWNPYSQFSTGTNITVKGEKDSV